MRSHRFVLKAASIAALGAIALVHARASASPLDPQLCYTCQTNYFFCFPGDEDMQCANNCGPFYYAVSCTTNNFDCNGAYIGCSDM